MKVRFVRTHRTYEPLQKRPFLEGANHAWPKSTLRPGLLDDSWRLQPLPVFNAQQTAAENISQMNIYHQKLWHNLRFTCLLFTIVLLSSCTSRLQYVGQALNSSSKLQTINVGADALQIFSIQTGEDSADSRMSVFYIGGSGCTSLSVYLAPYFSGAEPGLEFFGLDKTGVQKGDLGLSCSESFWENYTYDELLRRNLLAFGVVQAQYPDRTIVVMGTSEGGPIAFDMAARLPNIAKVAVIGAGGMTQRKELEVLSERQNALPQLQSIVSRIEADPDSTDAFELGFPHAYWSSVLDRDPRQALQGLSMPVLLVIGADDENVPVASARLADSLLSDSRLIEWPDADHVFQTPAGNQRQSVISVVTGFLLE